MKILVGCERSGIVREAFRKLGHDAWSCDVVPADDKSEFHYQEDVRKLLHEGWDMGIFFPDCTHICVSGARWFGQKLELQENALDFVARMMVAPIPRIAIENPVGIISSRIRKPDQIIQPYQFGHVEPKKTCLWLKNLPKLTPTKEMKPEYMISKSGKRLAKWYFMPSPSKQRQLDRQRTFQGIADAMANQWGNAFPTVRGQS